eukprot:GHVT01103111.1.p1 GENE.GHVT01103111.1~~GHVT01103111.1.p1  ORF type:complete len:1056 (+),score=92.20 GHVT01103111.1:3981-7148(+)
MNYLVVLMSLEMNSGHRFTENSVVIDIEHDNKIFHLLSNTSYFYNMLMSIENKKRQSWKDKFIELKKLAVPILGGEKDTSRYVLSLNERIHAVELTKLGPIRDRVFLPLEKKSRNETPRRKNRIRIASASQFTSFPHHFFASVKASGDKDIFVKTSGRTIRVGYLDSPGIFYEADRETAAIAITDKQKPTQKLELPDDILKVDEIFPGFTRIIQDPENPGHLRKEALKSSDVVSKRKKANLKFDEDIEHQIQYILEFLEQRLIDWFPNIPRGIVQLPIERFFFPVTRDSGIFVSLKSDALSLHTTLRLNVSETMTMFSPSPFTLSANKYKPTALSILTNLNLANNIKFEIETLARRAHVDSRIGRHPRINSTNIRLLHLFEDPKVLLTVEIENTLKYFIIDGDGSSKDVAKSILENKGVKEDCCQLVSQPFVNIEEKRNSYRLLQSINNISNVTPPGVALALQLAKQVDPSLIHRVAFSVSFCGKISVCDTTISPISSHREPFTMFYNESVKELKLQNFLNGSSKIMKWLRSFKTIDQPHYLLDVGNLRLWQIPSLVEALPQLCNDFESIQKADDWLSSPKQSIYKAPCQLLRFFMAWRIASTTPRLQNFGVMQYDMEVSPPSLLAIWKDGDAKLKVPIDPETIFNCHRMENFSIDEKIANVMLLAHISLSQIEAVVVNKLVWVLEQTGQNNEIALHLRPKGMETLPGHIARIPINYAVTGPSSESQSIDAKDLLEGNRLWMLILANTMGPLDENKLTQLPKGALETFKAYTFEGHVIVYKPWRPRVVIRIPSDVFKLGIKTLKDLEDLWFFGENSVDYDQMNVDSLQILSLTKKGFEVTNKDKSYSKNFAAPSTDQLKTIAKKWRDGFASLSQAEHRLTPLNQDLEKQNMENLKPSKESMGVFSGTPLALPTQSSSSFNREFPLRRTGGPVLESPLALSPSSPQTKAHRKTPRLLVLASVAMGVSVVTMAAKNIKSPRSAYLRKRNTARFSAEKRHCKKKGGSKNKDNLKANEDGVTSSFSRKKQTSTAENLNNSGLKTSGLQKPANKEVLVGQ